MSDSVIRQVYKSLKDQGVDVYFPGQHKGECLSKYVVIKDDGSIPVDGISSERPIYSFLCYAPENQYSELEDYKLEIKEKLKAVYPMLMYAGNDTPSIFDDSVQGHMVSFQYYGIRKINEIF